VFHLVLKKNFALLFKKKSVGPLFFMFYILKCLNCCWSCPSFSQRMNTALKEFFGGADELENVSF